MNKLANRSDRLRAEKLRSDVLHKLASLEEATKAMAVKATDRVLHRETRMARLRRSTRKAVRSPSSWAAVVAAAGAVMAWTAVLRGRRA